MANLQERAFAVRTRAKELNRGDWVAEAEHLRTEFAALESLARTPEQITALAATEIAALQALEAKVPPRPPAFVPGERTELSQPGGLAATEGTQVPIRDGVLGDPSHPLTEHGPATDPNWLRAKARTSDSGTAAKFLDRAVMETTIGKAISTGQARIQAWLATSPPPGTNLALPLFGPGLGNLGEGFYRVPGSRIVQPIPADMPLTHVQVVLRATGNPQQPYLIHTAYPALPP